jgi:hypothetical protein
MLSMDTTEQQLQNTKTYHNIIEKSNTTAIFEDKLFEDDKEINFPTWYVNDVRSFMTIGSTRGYFPPEYHEKIYEFDEEEIETKMKEFLSSNQNL